MRSLARLLTYARAHGLLRGLAFDAAALALAFAALAGLWIVTTPRAVAHPVPAGTPTEVSATGAPA